MARIETLLKITTYLCAVVGFGAVFRTIGGYYSSAFACLAVIALLHDCGRLPVSIPRWFLNLASVVVLVPSLYRMNPEDLVEPVLEGLLLLLGIKLLEQKKARDYMQIYLVCIFLLVGSALVSWNSSFALFFLALILLTTLALIFLAVFSHDPCLLITREVLSKLTTQALLVCALSIPSGALLFVVLPRADFPLFSFLNKVGGARSGFSDSVALGDVAEIQEDATAVLRAEMQRIPEQNLYWRGVELDRFDGTSWRRGPPRSSEVLDGVPGEGGIPQTIYLEPYGSRYLFALDRPVSIQTKGARYFRRIIGFWPEPIQHRIRYSAVSVIGTTGLDEKLDSDKYLALPDRFSERITALAEKTAGRDGDPVGNLLKLMRSGGFEYSLEGLPVSDSPLEDFLFKTRRGNCEYFASALAVMLRSVGIPARLIGGYRGGYYNPAGNYYLVLQKNAHVWVEAFQNGRWTRLDPTPFAVHTPATAYRDSFFMNLRLLIDTFDYYWGKFVINYDLSSQIALWRKITSAVAGPSIDLHAGSAWLKRGAVCVSLLLCLFPGVFIIRKVTARPEQKLLSGFLRRMRKHGYSKGAGEGLEEFLSRVTNPVLQAKAKDFVLEFEKVFYRDRKFSADETKSLKSCIRSL